MKKSIKLLCLSLFGALLFSCSNPAADAPKNNSGNNSESDSSYTKPELPDSSGINPFVGNSYSDNSTKYEFVNDGLLKDYKNYELAFEYEYSYDANTKELSLRYSKISNGDTLYSVQDYLNFLAADLNLTAADPDTQEDFIKYKELYETKHIWKAEIDVSGNLILQTEYFKEKPSFEELKSGSTYFINLNKNEKIKECHLGSREYVSGVYGYIACYDAEYRVEEITQDKIIAKNYQDSTDILTLSYTLNEPKDGILSITLTTTDSPSESYTLETEGPSTYTKVSE